MRVLPGHDPGWEPRCPTARELVAPPVRDEVPIPAASARRGAPEGLDDFRHWDANTQERALELLRAAETKPYRPFFCPRPGCDGMPHDNWAWNHARQDQHMPSLSIDWLVWLLSGGRGSGKTRTGAETINRAARHVPFLRLIAPTGPDIRDTMVEGESGLLATAPPDFRPQWEPSKKKLTWPNGAVALGFSAEEPDRLRGKQSVWDWLDEPAHMPLIEDVWSNMKFGLRIKNAKVTPRIVCTTTPKPIKWLKKLIKDEKTIVSRVSTYANINNLAETFASAVLEEYEGTRIGRQELHGELLEDVEGALWSVDLITYAPKVPEHFDRIVVAVDPAGSANKNSDETGIIVMGVVDGIIYVLADRTGKYSPSGWATAAVNAYNQYSADAIVAEKNYGGDMVREVLEKNGAGDIRILLVHSRRGKALRAEPIVALYERERVKHIKDSTPTLEDEQTSWVPPSSGGKMPSPNRVDALVHGATELANVRLPVEMAPPPSGRTTNSVPTAYGARRDPSLLVPSGR